MGKGAKFIWEEEKGSGKASFGKERPPLQEGNEQSHRDVFRKWLNEDGSVVSKPGLFFLMAVKAAHVFPGWGSNPSHSWDCAGS